MRFGSMRLPFLCFVSSMCGLVLCCVGSMRVGSRRVVLWLCWFYAFPFQSYIGSIRGWFYVCGSMMFGYMWLIICAFDSMVCRFYDLSFLCVVALCFVGSMVCDYVLCESMCRWFYVFVGSMCCRFYVFGSMYVFVPCVLVYVCVGVTRCWF